MSEKNTYNLWSRLLNAIRHNNRLLFYAASLLVAFSLPLSGLPGIRYNSIAIILLLVSWLLDGNLKQKFLTFFRNRLALLFSSVYFIHLFGLFFTENFQEANRELTVRLSLFLLPLIYSTSPKLDASELKGIFLVFIFSTLAVTLYLFKDGFVYTFGNLYNPHHITIGKREILGRVYCSAYLAFSFFILLIHFFRPSRVLSGKNFLILLCVVYIIYINGILIVKMTIVAALLILPILLIIYLIRQGKKVIALVICFILFSGTILSYHNNTRIQEIVHETFSSQPITLKEEIEFTDTSFSTRFSIWSAAIEILQEGSNWLTGTGTGDTPDELSKMYRIMNLPPETYRDPHSEYLSVILKTGIIGLFLFIASLIIPLYQSIKQNNYLYVSFLLLCVLCMLTESWHSRQVGVIFYSFFNSLFCFHVLKEK